MYDKQTGAFIDAIESPKYNIARANEFRSVFQRNDKQEILKIIKEVQIDTEKKDLYNDGYNYLKIISKIYLIIMNISMGIFRDVL